MLDFLVKVVKGNSFLVLDGWKLGQHLEKRLQIVKIHACGICNCTMDRVNLILPPFKMNLLPCPFLLLFVASN